MTMLQCRGHRASSAGGIVPIPRRPWSTHAPMASEQLAPGTHLGSARQPEGHALDGRLLSDVSRLNAEGGTGTDRKVLEAYVPVRSGSGRSIGVFELYQNYATITTEARDEFLPLAGLVALVLLVLYASFFPIL